MLCVIIRKGDAFFSNAIDVRRLVTHHAAIVVADIPRADVIPPDDQDVGFFSRCNGAGNDQKHNKRD
ncbi:hypothetical protein [Kaarinaea lacus]